MQDPHVGKGTQFYLYCEQQLTHWVKAKGELMFAIIALEPVRLNMDFNTEPPFTVQTFAEVKADLEKTTRADSEFTDEFQQGNYGEEVRVVKTDLDGNLKKFL